MTQGLDTVVHLGKFQCSLVCVCVEECEHNTQAVGCRDVPELAPFDPGSEFKESADYEGYYTVKSPAGLILAHHHRPTSKDDPSQGVCHDVETALDGFETDVNLDIGPLPAPEVSVQPVVAPLVEEAPPLAPLAPVSTRFGQEIRSQTSKSQTFKVPNSKASNFQSPKPSNLKLM